MRFIFWGDGSDFFKSLVDHIVVRDTGNFNIFQQEAPTSI